jgi:hypothetical protein
MKGTVICTLWLTPINTDDLSYKAPNLCGQYEDRSKPSDSISKTFSSKSEVASSSREQAGNQCRQPPAKYCDQTSQQPNPLSSENNLNPTSSLAHSQPITSSSAFNTPYVRHNLPGFWPTTIANPETPYGLEPAPKQPSSIGARYPLASTPITVYSNPPSFGVFQPTGRTTSINPPYSFDSDDPSNPSSKEIFLQNINQDLSRDVLLLIEDRLKDLFSTFLSDLSKVVEPIPSTLLESCFNNFNSSMKFSISKLITEEIVPSLIEKLIDNLSDQVNKEPSNHHCPSYAVETTY